jgi:bacterioferritin-associated ferredoxin
MMHGHRPYDTCLGMNRRQKTASHLERMVLTDMRRYALCNGVSAVTVRPTADGMGWEVADFHAPGGVPAACREIGLAAAEALREHYDLLPDSQLAPDDDLRLP